MRAVVLVGGEGTRLRPLTATVPKQMLPVAEVPMIERVIRRLEEHGVDEAVLSMGYRPDPFYSLFPSDRCGRVAIRYAVDPEPLDTAGAIRYAAAAAGIGETFIAVNGDVLTDLDIGTLVEFHHSHGAEATLHLHRVDDPSAFGLVVTDPDGRVRRFVEKPPPGEAPTDTINAGTYVLEPTVLERIAPDRRVSIEREVFPAIVADGSLFALPVDCYWLDTGTPEKYLQANLDLLGGIRPGPPAPGAIDRGEGAWTIGDPVLDGTLVGPALAGPAAYLQSGAMAQGSVLGSGSRVHARAEVRRSLLLPGAVVHSGAVVEDSIVGGNAVIGEEAYVSAQSVVGYGEDIEPGAHLEGARVPDPAGSTAS